MYVLFILKFCLTHSRKNEIMDIERFCINIGRKHVISLYLTQISPDQKI